MRQKRTRAVRQLPRAPDEYEPRGAGEDLPHWLVRVETGWGMPHAIVAIAASFVIGVRALPSVAERMAARWGRRRG